MRSIAGRQMRPLTPLLAGQASVFTPPLRGSPKGEDEVFSIDNFPPEADPPLVEKRVLCYQRFYTF